MSPEVLDPPEAMTDTDVLYEVINGEKVVKTMSVFENHLAGELHGFLRDCVRANRVGRATVEVMFELPGLDRDRRPDVAFVSFAKWPANRRPPTVNAWPVVPDLMAEVVSPPDDMSEVMEKVEEYFRVGVTLVWLVLPQQEKVYVYTSPTGVHVLARMDELTGDPVLPTFRLALTELFPPPDVP